MSESPSSVVCVIAKERESGYCFLGSRYSILKTQTITFLSCFPSLVCQLRESCRRFTAGSSVLTTSFLRTDADLEALWRTCHSEEPLTPNRPCG